MQLSGSATVAVGGFVLLSNVNLALEYTTLPSVTVTNGTTPQTLTNAQLLTFGMNGASGFVGINGGTSQATGFTVNVNNLAFALVAPNSPSDDRAWVTLDGNVTANGFSTPSDLPLSLSTVPFRSP